MVKSQSSLLLLLLLDCSHTTNPSTLTLLDVAVKRLERLGQSKLEPFVVLLSWVHHHSMVPVGNPFSNG